MSEAVVEPGVTADYRVVERCRVCRASDLVPFLDLGAMPLANAFLPPDRADRPEARYPLATQRCATCGLVQLTIVVRGEILFGDYLYSSSASQPMVAHFAAYAEVLASSFAPPGSLVVEIGSNDGVLLRPLAARGVRVVGVEPADRLAGLANAEGLETWPEFFSSQVAIRIRDAKGAASAVVANNVFAHVDDLRDVVRGVRLLIEPDGVFVAEFPYLRDLLELVEYDTIYHEHLSYFSLSPLRVLFAAEGLELLRVRKVATHGGSLRIIAGRIGAHPVDPSVGALFASEAAGGIFDPDTYVRFASQAAESRAALRSLLADLRLRGARLAAHGATAKGNTLLNYCGFSRDTLEFVADSTPSKQGLLTPGTHIPVVPEEALERERPDYTLLLAWNYADTIVRRQARYVANGGRFIHPIPRARVIGGA